MKIPLYIFFGILILLLILFVIFLFLKIRLEISYKKENGKKGSLLICISFFGTMLKKEISLKEKNDGKEKKKEDAEKLPLNQKIQKYQETFEKMRYVWTRSRRKIRKNIFAEKISLDMSVGFEDAFFTGILTGSLWALIYTVVGFVSDIIKIRVPKINITPVYNEDFFEADGKCIIAASPANIISMGVKILLSYYVVKKKFDKETKKEKAADNYGNTN